MGLLHVSSVFQVRMIRSKQVQFQVKVLLMNEFGCFMDVF